MTWTLSNTNYNGEVLQVLYSVFGIGNEIVEKGAARLLTDISTKKALPKLSQTDNPIGDYVDGVPTSDTVTTTYAERELVMEKMTLYEEFKPTDWHSLWKIWQSIGDMTNLAANPQLLAAVLELYQNGIGRQMSKIFWQGDKTLGAGNAMNKFNGIVTRAAADADVIDVANIGVIAKSNVIEIIENFWAAIPDKFLDDDNFRICMNTTDWKYLQQANNDIKKTTVGILSQEIEELFLKKRIVHFQGMPASTILGARQTNDDSSNLFLGVWVIPEDEEPIIAKKEAAGRTWFVRIDFKADANYREGSEIVLYQGS